MVAVTVSGSTDQIPLVRCPKGNAGPPAAIPAVDLSAPGAAAAVADACHSLGFFRATNHGVPAALADALEAGAMAFFALPHKEKMDMSCAARPLGYGSKSIGSNGDVGWLEYLLLSVSSSSVPVSSLPPLLRVALEEYTRAVREVGGRVLELMAEGLGVGPPDALARLVADADSDSMLRVNHYPPRHDLQGNLTGFGEHTDPQIISVLRSNGTSGLEISLRDGAWASVPPDGDSFFVNVGDALQVLTNGRFTSVRHRVVVNSERPRVSMIFFGGPPPGERLAPLRPLLGDGGRSRYREFTWKEYKSKGCRGRLADDRLCRFEN